MNSCYYCGTVLSNKNRTGEHVLPNAIGGRMVSYKLLCRGCNILLGGKIDVELARRYDDVMTSSGINRDRKKRPEKLRVVGEAGEELTKEQKDVLVLKAVAKIAINVYLHYGGAVKHVQLSLDIIKDVRANEGHIHAYTSPTIGGLLHSVTIKGSAEQRSLYAYVVLFWEHGFIVNLDEAYEGEEISYTYCLDLATGKGYKKHRCKS